MKRILLIDNDYTVLNKVSGLFEKVGYQIYLAQDGKKGFELAKLIKPALIICDTDLPGLNGFELLKKLMLNQETAAIPFMYLTTKSNPKDINKAMQLGADSYIIKPCYSEELLEIIEKKLKKIKLFKKDIKFKDTKQHNLRRSKNDRLNDNSSLLIDIEGIPKLIKINDIESITAQGDYTDLFIKDRGRVIVRRSLKSWEEMLSEDTFIRIHRSIMVNIDFIESIEKWHQRAYKVKMKYSKESFVSSQRYTVKLRARLKA